MDNFFCKNLKYLRESNRYSQKQLAKEIGIPTSSLSNYELGKTVPGIDALQKIYVFFKVSPTAILHSDLEKQKGESKTESSLYMAHEAIKALKGENQSLRTQLKLYDKVDKLLKDLNK